MIHWDAHACLRLHPQADFEPINRLRAAGVHYVSVNVGMDMNPLAQVMSVIAGYTATIAASPERYLLVRSLQDIDNAAASGRIGIGFDLEGAMPLLEQPDMVALYARLGVRQMHLAYNRNNSVAGGCHDDEQGLTPLGHKMVAAINAAGILMDCSHTGRRSSLDIMAASGPRAHAIQRGAVRPAVFVDQQRRRAAENSGRQPGRLVRIQVKASVARWV